MLERKTALVTGSTSGIGAHIADALAPDPRKRVEITGRGIDASYSNAIAATQLSTKLQLGSPAALKFARRIRWVFFGYDPRACAIAEETR